MQKPRIVMVTPELSYLPDKMGTRANYVMAKAGGLADISAALVKLLFDQGWDVHVAIPNYRNIFQIPFKREKPDERIHLAEDRAFYYQNKVYPGSLQDNMRNSLPFQREVINNTIPRVQPDLIHCNDWMTALIPAMARQIGIPCLFTIHNIHTVKSTLAIIEDRGIDAAAFWNHLYYDRYPYNYEESRDSNPVDFLTSGIFASHFVNTVSPTFLEEIVNGRHSFVSPSIQRELKNKYDAGCAVGILNAPDPSFNPTTDQKIAHCYDPSNHGLGKQENKLKLQEQLGLIKDKDAPLFFWPSRLDNVQKGCQLLADILYRVISTYWEQKLQIVFIANGEYQPYFRQIVDRHGFHDRVAVQNFDETLEHLAYAASDFILMPSLYEPCGLPQMVAPIYGSLPVARDTGGIHDTIEHLNVDGNSGNGFLFKDYDANGLFWAITQAMQFYALDETTKAAQIERIMTQSLKTFNYSVCVQRYIDLYEAMLKRPM